MNRFLGNAKELAAAEILLDPSGVIKELHQVAFLAAESCNIAQALHAYEQAYNIAHQSKYVGAEHVVTCAFLVWYRGIDGNVDGARQASRHGSMRSWGPRSWISLVWRALDTMDR